MKKIFPLIAFLSIVVSVCGQKYVLDNSFGDNGIISYVSDFSYSLGYKIIALTDGSYLISGIIDDEQNKQVSFSIMKFQNNGQIEKTFGENGYFNIFTDHSEYPMDFITLPNNKICFAISDINGHIEFVILNENGSFFKKFTLSPFPNNYLIPIRLLFKDDHIYIGGIYNSKSIDSELMFVLKIDLDGNLDKSFANNGVFISESNIYLNARFQDMAFQNDDIIILSSENDLSNTLFLYRIDQDGAVDISFSDDGVYSAINTAAHEYGKLNIDRSGNIYITFFNSTGVLKVNSGGFIDENYGNNGYALDGNFQNVINNSFYSILQNDNSVLIFGSTRLENSEQFGLPAIVKYTKNGKNDVQFGDKGIYITETEYPASYLNGCIDTEDKLLAIGGWEKLSGNHYSQILIVRYKFNSSGVDETNFANSITLFPNPVSSNHIMIENKNHKNIITKYVIFDNYGKNLAIGQLNTNSYDDDQYEIELPINLKNGFYYLLLSNDFDSESIKLVVQKKVY